MEWKEADAPFITVAHLTLLQQDPASARGQRVSALVGGFSFDRWHALAEFRPLGNVMSSQPGLPFEHAGARGGVRARRNRASRLTNVDEPETGPRRRVFSHKCPVGHLSPGQLIPLWLLSFSIGDLSDLRTNRVLLHSPRTASCPRSNDGMGLEKKFVLWLSAVLAVGTVVYSLLEAERTNSIATLLVIAVVGATAWAIAHYVLFEPMRRLVVMAKAVGAGDFSKRLRFDRPDEIGSLALEMDTMCDQLEAAELVSEAHIAALEQLRHSDRIATLGRLASSVAHELGNPLNVIELRAQLITSGDTATLHQAQQNAA